MQTIVRQSVGVDIAKSTFTASCCKRFQNGSVELSEVLSFENTRTGFNQLVKWVRKNFSSEFPAVYVMEATGIYYEPLAYHLHKLGLPVSVVLPNVVNFFGKSLNIKSKTDEIDARLIARLGAERILAVWDPPSSALKHLRDLTRMYTDLKQQKTVFTNRLHSIEAGHEPLAFIITSTKSIIAKLDKEIEKMQEAIRNHISGDPVLKEKVAKIETIKGVGLITIAIVLAETQGFKLIRNAKQLTSYAGYDVVQRESGSSIKGKTRISKKGNSRIRAALHFPALVSSRYNEELKETFSRIVQKRPSKMVGMVALQRKILVLIYALWKNNTVFEPNRTAVNQEIKSLLSPQKNRQEEPA